MSVASPCINVCRMDPRRGTCEGCFRTIEEITVWARASDAQRQDILKEVEARRAAHALFEDDLRCDCDR
ncbi:MAG: DUF1289 domain-containing protein [Rhodocyclaceae bacterium]|nr:DUF1289 domain-containing protein [Rhodocyclaceae bacterium]